MLWTGFLAISLQRLWFYPARNPIEQEGYGFEGSFHSLSFLSFLFFDSLFFFGSAEISNQKWTSKELMSIVA